MNEPSHAGRTAVITGASRGIGAGLADELTRRGLLLGLCSRSLPDHPDPEHGVAQQVDVTDADALPKQLARTWQPRTSFAHRVIHLLDGRISDPEPTAVPIRKEASC